MNLEQLEQAHKLTIRRANILQAIIRLKDPGVNILVNEPSIHSRDIYWHCDGVDIDGNDKIRLGQAMTFVLGELIDEIDATLRDWGVENSCND